MKRSPGRLPKGHSAGPPAAGLVGKWPGACCNPRQREVAVNISGMQDFGRLAVESFDAADPPKGDSAPAAVQDFGLLELPKDDSVLQAIKQQGQELRAMLQECTKDLQQAHQEHLERSETLLKTWLLEDPRASFRSEELASTQAVTITTEKTETRYIGMVESANRNEAVYGREVTPGPSPNPTQSQQRQQDMPASMEIGQLNDSIEALRSAQHYTSSDSETINHTQSKPKNMRSLMSSTSNIFDGDVKKAFQGIAAEFVEDAYNKEIQEEYRQLEERGCLGRIVVSIWFRVLMCFMILMNTVIIGAHSQYLLEYQLELPGRSPTGNEVYKQLEIGMLVVFCLEALVRLVVLRCEFFTGPEYVWNIFDLLVILPGILGMFDFGTVNVSFLRLLKFQSFLRVLRILRVMRNFSSLRVMVVTLARCSLTMVGFLVMLFFVLYCFAMLFVQGITTHLENAESLDPEFVVQVGRLYGSLIGTMITLFEAIAGGIDWYEAYVVLGDLGWPYRMAFLFYIYFTVFGVLNILSSMFIDTIYQVAQGDRDAQISKEVENLQNFEKGISAVFMEADRDSSGHLSWDQFEVFMQDERSRAALAAMELDVTKARALFLLLDEEKTDKVSMRDFVDGCQRLRGLAKSIDVNLILYENERMMMRWQRFMEQTERCLGDILSDLDTTRSQMSQTPSARYNRPMPSRTAPLPS